MAKILNTRLAVARPLNVLITAFIGAPRHHQNSGVANSFVRTLLRTDVQGKDRSKSKYDTLYVQVQREMEIRSASVCAFLRACGTVQSNFQILSKKNAIWHWRVFILIIVFFFTF
jgi:hypothetical protein